MKKKMENSGKVKKEKIREVEKEKKNIKENK